MPEPDGTRADRTAQVAALIAADLGLDAAGPLTPEQRDRIARETAEALAPGAPVARSESLRRAVADYHRLDAEREDRGNAVLAERGEVFAPEDDA